MVIVGGLAIGVGRRERVRWWYWGDEEDKSQCHNESHQTLLETG
jgi:hypothetical protein